MCRHKDIDTIAGVMIITMLYCHVQVGYDALGIYKYWSQVFHFFMPWFFFKAGMFHKQDYSFYQTFKYCYSRLLIPFFIFSLVGTIIVAFLYFLQNNLHKNFLWSPFRYLWQGGFVLGNEPLWFLVSLTVIKLVFSKIFRKSIIIVSSLFGITVAYLLFLFKANTPLWVANVSSGVFFYSCGFLFKDVQYKYLSVSICSFIIYILIAVIYPSNYVSVYNVAVGSYPLAIISSLAGCLFINSLFRRMNINNKMLSYIGKNSMAYLVLHMILINLVCIFSLIFGLNDIMAFYIKFLSIILFIPMSLYYFKQNNKLWMFGILQSVSKQE